MKNLMAYIWFQFLLIWEKVLALDIAGIMGQTISTTQFFVYGKRHFTKTGYLKHVKDYKDSVQSSACIGINGQGADGVDLTGKVVVVTGANSGLGKEVATYAAAKGAKLYMLCRNAERAEQAKKDILSSIALSSSPEKPQQEIEILLADVSDMSQIRTAVKALQEKETKVHVLVCNAGVLLSDRQVSSEGNEITFASHLLGGSYLLPQLLLPQLKAAEDPRVIIVTSGGMYSCNLPNWNVLTSSNEAKYNGVNAYAYAKRGQVLVAEQMAKQESDVTWVTVHPGWADTNAVDEAFGENKKYLMPLRSAWEGAEGVAWLVGASKHKLSNGAFYLDRTIQPKHMAGPFFTEGSYTKNKPEEIDQFMAKLKRTAGLE